MVSSRLQRFQHARHARSEQYDLRASADLPDTAMQSAESALGVKANFSANTVCHGLRDVPG
jgi:hypothetical protein